jgi:hypothetical protein
MRAALTKTGTDIRSLTVHANGIRQHYLEAGSGPPLPQEEQPEVVTRLLADFLESWKG